MFLGYNRYVKKPNVLWGKLEGRFTVNVYGSVTESSLKRTRPSFNQSTLGPQIDSGLRNEWGLGHYFLLCWIETDALLDYWILYSK